VHVSTSAEALNPVAGGLELPLRCPRPLRTPFTRPSPGPKNASLAVRNARKMPLAIGEGAIACGLSTASG